MTGVRLRREDGIVPGSARTCAVCHRERSLGAVDQSGDLFVCVGCQADAQQFLETQDQIFGGAGATGEESDGIDKPARP
jgi:hypothetical protein